MSADDRTNKFKELAEKRVTKAIKQLRLIGNLANRGNYEYTEDDVQKILKVLNDELKALKSKFENQGRGDSPTFKL